MTWSQLLAKSAALLNDFDQSVYTNAVQLAYLNIARDEIQEVFELNNIPVTNEESAILTISAGDFVVGFEPAIPVPGTPYLPSDLIEIQQLWESQEGQNAWIPVDKQEFMTATIPGGAVENSFFGFWAWMDQEIRLHPANQDNDLKIDYIKSLFVDLAIGDVGDDINILNVSTTLMYRVAGLCAQFIMENMERANSLNAFASTALDRSLGISTKGKQSIVFRRRPFRASWKSRGVIA